MTITGPHSPEVLLARALDRFGTAPDDVGAVARWLRAAAADVDLPDTAPGDRVVLAGNADGPGLYLAHFVGELATDVHGHGTWGGGLLLDGTDRYERWRPVGPGTARLAEVRALGPGDVLAFGPPPHDVHRQRADSGGARELLLLGSDPRSRDRVTFEPDPADPAAAVVDHIDRADLHGLLAHYAPGAVVAADVPQWRLRVTGRAAIAQALASEFDVPGRRLAWLRRTDTADGVLVETEVRFAADGGEGLWRDAHVLTLDGSTITAHSVWCTGHWDPATVARYAAQAPDTPVGAP
ncbi:MAG: nuclear transport factor 2 family protein [Pseudonocardia sp.]